MSKPQHAAHKMPIDELIDILNDAKLNGHMLFRNNADRDLWHWRVSNRGMYHGRWATAMRVANGLIIDRQNKKIVATPFQNFYSYHREFKNTHAVVNVTEYIDGFMLIIYHHNDRWNVATKNELCEEYSDLIATTQDMLDDLNLDCLDKDTTYIAQYTGPTFKKINDYDEEQIYLLAAFKDGYEIDYDDLIPIASQLDWRMPYRHRTTNYNSAVSTGRNNDIDGVVILFANGSRLLVNSDYYLRRRMAAERCTPLGIWEAMMLNKMYIFDSIPDHFKNDYRIIMSTINKQYFDMQDAISEAASNVSHMTDKELGLALDELPFPHAIKSKIFNYRKSGMNFTKEIREKIFRSIRPTNNFLEDYAPSKYIDYMAGIGP